MYSRIERRFNLTMKSRRFFCFLNLCLLVCTAATAHNTVLRLLQDCIIPALHAQPQAQIR
jgi:hypothetical protein